MLLVFLMLLPDRSIGIDNQALVIHFRVCQQRFHDIVPGALIEPAAICRCPQQSVVVVTLQVLTQYLQHKPPIVELNIGIALAGEKRLFGAIPEIADN